MLSLNSLSSLLAYCFLMQILCPRHTSILMNTQVLCFLTIWCFKAMDAQDTARLPGPESIPWLAHPQGRFSYLYPLPKPSPALFFPTGELLKNTPSSNPLAPQFFDHCISSLPSKKWNSAICSDMDGPRFAYQEKEVRQRKTTIISYHLHVESN